jgi:hypothetical protein
VSDFFIKINIFLVNFYFFFNFLLWYFSIFFYI